LVGEVDIVREAGAEAVAEGIPAAGAAGAVVVAATGKLPMFELSIDDFIPSSIDNRQ
jgi:hypothetical protein